MAVGVIPIILNPKSVSRYDGLPDAGRYHAADTRTPEDNKPRRFLRVPACS
jgi:hypothetical protein